MTRNNILSMICLPVLAALSHNVFAGGELVKSFNLIAHDMVMSPVSNMMYASTTHDNSVAVINANTLEHVTSISVGSAPARMAVNPAGDRLYVALSGATSIAVIDLTTYTLLPEIPMPYPPYDVAIGHNNRMYVTPGRTSGGYRNILQVNLLDNTIMTEFGSEAFPYYSALIEISGDLDTLYMANRGLSPGTLAKFDVTTEVPVFMLKNPHGDLGSNGQDLHVSRDGNHAYYAVGGGNRIAGYDIAQISTDTFAINGVFNTGPYPREITTGPDGKTAYAVHTAGHIDVWNAESFLQLQQYNITGEAYELITDHSGDYLFAATSTQIHVYTAEGSAPVIDNDLDGIDDSVDNCVDLYNPDQTDTDEDLIGNECDIFPYEKNHELAHCRVDLGDSAALIQYYEDLIEEYSSIRDDDGDGEINQNDLCPMTPNAISVDSNGCSHLQFCSAINQKEHCKKSDWKNDEFKRANDCDWVQKQCVISTKGKKKKRD
ncbi:MAG: YncE family protein [Gammaproteobacteria bacterium]|nr:YncE family protein [Gammaproteobacteria bacterium]